MESFNYRPYFNALRRALPWMVLALLAVAAISLLRPVPPPIYSATATVAAEYNSPLSVLPNLEAAAKDPSVFEAVYDGWKTTNTAKPSLQSLQERLNASLSSENKVISLTAVAATPEEAIQLANLWQEATFAFLQQYPNAITTRSEALAAVLLDEKTNAIVQFNAAQPETLLATRLEEIQSTLKNIDSEKRWLKIMLDTVKETRRAESLSAMLDSFNQKDGVTPLAYDPAQPDLPELIRLIEKRLTNENAEEQQLGNEALKIQNQLNQNGIERNRLQVDYDAAKRVYTDAQYYDMSLQAVVQYKSQPTIVAIPNQTSLPRSLRTVLAGAVGILAVALLAIAKTWWGQARRP